ARAFRQPLALLMLRVGDDASFGAVLARLRTGLRSFEHLGLYSDDVVELLLPQCDEDEAARRAGELSSTAGGAACGVGVYPRHGSTADELLGAARAALATASAATPVRHAEARTARIVADPATVEGDVVAASAAMRSLMDTIARIADAGIPVLIQGETGTGKELVARAIHRQGPRSGGPLVCVNCGGIPGQLVESTLFGHERGAFTGADRQAKGVFEAASGGTILLDEIGELPPAAQAALLRVLESGHVSRVGSTTEIRVDVRVLAATHRDLAAWADEGRFRRDLLYRLNAMTLEIPPLRERTEDIPPLARHFLACSADAVTAGVDGIDGAVMALLQVHSWPGNVRELRNAIERAAVIARDTSITLDDLPEPVRRLQRTDPGPAPAPAPAPAPDVGRRPAGVGPLRERLRRYEIELIVEALNLHGGHRGRAAAALGVPLRTLSHRIQALGIRRGRYQRPGE
ncbi:MAG: sigma-54 dependent transcriptional regulator, partial [Myxococcota bacterium]|nr:sigma-54 dependent transcriptional regulator [Myxococcota bacterium]